MKNLRFKLILLPVWEFLYYLTVLFVRPINLFLARILRKRVWKNSVLHISFMVHLPYYTVQLLRQHGLKADYMAIGKGIVWDKCDYPVIYSKIPLIRVVQEMYWFWKIVTRYEVIHAHFMITVSYSGWEVPILKAMGRKIVIHYRGCDIRERTKNMQLHPEVNVCQECDYFHPAEKRFTCELKYITQKRALAKKYGDVFLVTTPDLKEFSPQATLFPFFSPQTNVTVPSFEGNHEKQIKIVHVTNHPGIEGTKEIREAIEHLKQEGYDINFIFLKGVHHEEVLKEYRDADLSVGKMKMGHYANAQIESMCCGVPAITYVRPEFMTEELKNSGFIFSSLKELKVTLKYYLSNREALSKKKGIARSSILALHNNEQLIRQLISLYFN